MRKVDLSFLDFLLVPGQAGLPASSSTNHQPTTASQPQQSHALSSSPPGAPAMFGATSAGGKGSPSYFEALYTKEGFGRLKEWFCSFASGTNQKNEEETKYESDAVLVHEETDCLPDGYLSERQFVDFISSICECTDNETLEIFDIFSRQTGRLEFAQLFVLLSAFAARESANLTQYLYLHGMDMFILLSDPRAHSLPFERFSKLGVIIGLSEDFLLSKLIDHGHHAFHRLDAEGFMLYYFDVFSCVDMLRKKNKYGAGSATDAYLLESSHGGKKQGKDCLIC